MKLVFSSWPFWALLSAVFAASTAILAKIGVAMIAGGAVLAAMRI